MRSCPWLLLLAGVFLASGCGGPASSDDDPGDSVDDGGSDDGATDDGADDSVEYLSPTDHLIRASMALRGVRPSAADLTAVRDDPDAIAAIVDRYVESPAFGATMRDLHGEALLTRFASLPLPAIDDLADAQTGPMQASLGEEPLRLIEHVIMEDRPYTEIVTADYTMADRTVATAYGLAYDEAGPAWQEARYTDGRPAAGVLATTAFMVRHRSAGDNFNRGRANALSKALLCYDFLSRDVEIDGSIDLSDPEVVANAVVENEACASCHQTLDPLASFVWGFNVNLNQGEIERSGYPLQAFFQPDQVNRWRRTSHRPPGYFGVDADGLDGLGRAIAADPRFSSCAARRFYSYMTQEPLDEVPFELVASLQAAFIESGYSAKALAAAVVMSQPFRVSHATGDSSGEHVVGLKKARPEQLGRMFRELTGFTWETYATTRLRGGPVGRVDLMQDDTVGFNVLAGGIDSFYVVTPSHSFNATYSLVLRTLAAAAAGFVVEADFDEADPAARALLTRVELADTDEANVRAQLADLYVRLYGDFSPPESEAIGEAYELYRSTLERTDDPAHAWKTTLTALFQDLRIATF
jgi:hypothetical protein